MPPATHSDPFETSALPLLRLRRVMTPFTRAEVRVLVGSFTSTGSLWDGVAARAVGAAGMARGETLVSASLADYGLSATLAAVRAGLKSIVVTPESVSQERRDGLLSLGATVERMPEGTPLDQLWARAQSIASGISGGWAVAPTQADVDAIVGPPLSDLGLADAFVCGAGSGMTFRAGVAALRPARTVLLHAGGPHHVQGWGGRDAGRELSADDVLEVSDVQAWQMRTRLAREEGLLTSLSGAANVVGALDVAARLPAGACIYTVVWGTGERDFSLGRYFP